MRRPSVLEWILIGFLLGIVAGATVGPSIVVIKPLGTIFIRLLKMLVVPLIFCTLTAGQMAIAGVTALLASIGTAGVPGTGLIMLTMVLGSVGVPLEGIAFIAGIDRIMDMARTAVNVVDDSVAAAMVAVTEGETLPEDMMIR